MKNKFLRFSALTVLIVWAIGLKSFAQLDITSAVTTEPPTTVTYDNPVYSVDATSWSTGLPTTLLSYMGSGAITGGKLYAMAGNQTTAAGAAVAIYDFTANTWTTGTPLPAARVVGAGIGTSNAVYYIGGSNGSVYQNTIYELIPPATVWTTKVAIPVLLGWPAATVYQDSCIFILGGVVGSAAVNTVYLFNRINNTIRTCTPLPAARFGGAAGMSSNILVYAGGCDMFSVMNTVYEGAFADANKTAITWTTGTAMTVGLFRTTGATYGTSEMIVANGCSSTSWIPAYPCPAVSYNAATNTWRSHPNLPTAVVGAVLASYNSSGIYWKLGVVSGYTGSACAANTQILIDDVVGITTNSTAKFSVYPNPVVDMLYIASDKIINNIKVYNLAGQLVYESLVKDINTQINTTSLTDGMYVLQIEATDGISTQKFNVVK